MIIKKTIYVYICFMFILMQVNAQIVFNNNSGRILIGKNLWVLKSKTNLSFDEVLKSKEFNKIDVDVPNLGISDNNIWLRFSINNQTKNSNLLLEVAYPILQEVELRYLTSNTTYISTILGEKNPFILRKYKYPNFIFDLNIPPGYTRTYYVRVKSFQQIFIPLYIEQSSYLLQTTNVENLLIGTYLGIVLIMFLYNLFIYFSVNDTSYLYYILYIAFTGLTQIGLKGFNYQYFWPNSPKFELTSIVLFASLSVISAVVFTKKFLLIKRHTIGLNSILTTIIYAFICIIFLSFIGFNQLSFQLMQIATSVSSVLVLYTACLIMLKGYKPAIFFFYAWVTLLIGAIIFLLKDSGVLPYNTFTSYSVQFASAIEMALLSFGLADRINIYKKEKEQSQGEALFTSEENRRLISEQNITLERNVKERTYDLVTTNKNLSKTLTDLKEAQMQLVEAEKMASLGQLTAGIAHEINNPINFVTSNVAPLRRDVDMLVDAIINIESVGLSDATTEEKQQQIDDYKEEIELDYLKVEINHLLNGIHEGATRTADIVKGLKIFSRLDEDDLKKADINEGLVSTLIIANNLIGNKIQVIKNLGNVPVIECYPGKLNQVFLNIISNAVFAIQEKFNNQNGGLLEITTTNDDQHLIIQIKDNGTGMSEATKNKIFEPFFTTKNVGVGTGLGMSIVYNTIKKHNAEIYLNSTEGVGTEFIIKLNLVFEEIIADYQSEQQG